MRNADSAEKIANFSSIGTRAYSKLVRFSIENKPAWNDTYVRTAEIVLSRKLEPDSSQLKVKCRGVVEIKMHSLGLNQTGGCVITAYDISDRGLEGVRYQVNDIENEFFSLQCGDFEFAIQEPIFEAVDQEPGLSLS